MALVTVHVVVNMDFNNAFGSNVEKLNIELFGGSLGVGIFADVLYLDFDDPDSVDRYRLLDKSPGFPDTLLSDEPRKPIPSDECIGSCKTVLAAISEDSEVCVHSTSGR